MESNPNVSGAPSIEDHSFICTLENTIHELVYANEWTAIRIMLRTSFFAAQNNNADKKSIIRMYLSAGVPQHHLLSIVCEECDITKEEAQQFFPKQAFERINEMVRGAYDPNKTCGFYDPDKSWGFDEI